MNKQTQEFLSAGVGCSIMTLAFLVMLFLTVYVIKAAWTSL